MCMTPSEIMSPQVTYQLLTLSGHGSAESSQKSQRKSSDLTPGLQEKELGL